MFHKASFLPVSHPLRIAVVAIILTTLFVDGFDVVPVVNSNVISASPFITLTEAPPNDNFANAQPILGASGIINGTTVSATKEPGEPNHAGNAGGGSVWYRWQAPESGRFVFSTFGTDPLINTLLAVYTGNSFLGTNVASNDDENQRCSEHARHSRLGFDAVGGVVYHIAVDRTSSGANGNITLRWARSATIRGSITSVSGGPGVPVDVTIRLMSGSACRISEALFSILFSDVAIGGNYSLLVTSQLASLIRWGTTQSLSPLTGDVSSYNYFKASPAYSISGTATTPGGDISNLTVTCASIPDGQAPGFPVDFVISRPANISANGSYVCAALPEDGDYVITPSKPGIIFTPRNQTFTRLRQNLTFVNFIGALAPLRTISGRVTLPNGTTGVSGVSVALSGSQSASSVTDANGNYSFTGVLQGGNYTVTAASTNFTFSPASRSFNNVTADQTANFTASFVLQLVLDELAQVAALDSVLLMRDPFPVINNAVLNNGVDRNTRVAIFLSNFQLGPTEPPSSVVINLVGSNSQSYDIAADDVRPLSDGFTRVTFRLPDTLTAGTCTLLVKARGLTSNIGALRIRN